MKKAFIIGIFILLFVAGILWYLKHKKEKEGEASNPVYNLNPEQKTRKGSKYKALTPPQVLSMAKEVMVKLPSNIVLPHVKIDLINRLLLLQKESLLSVYESHWNNYGVSRGKDLLWYLENTLFLKTNKRAKALAKALKTLLPGRPALIPTKAPEKSKIFPW